MMDLYSDCIKKIQVSIVLFVVFQGLTVWQRPYVQRAISDATEVFLAVLIPVTNILPQ